MFSILRLYGITSPEQQHKNTGEMSSEPLIPLQRVVIRILT